MIECQSKDDTVYIHHLYIFANILSDYNYLIHFFHTCIFVSIVSRIVSELL